MKFDQAQKHQLGQQASKSLFFDFLKQTFTRKIIVLLIDNPKIQAENINSFIMACPIRDPATVNASNVTLLR